MVGRFELPAERAHSAEAWVALVVGASSDIEADLPADPTTCPFCEGSGVIPIFTGHGQGDVPGGCAECGGTGEVRP